MPSTENKPFESLDLPAEEFRKLGYQVVDMMAAYYATIRERSIVPKNDSATIAKTFEQALPEKGLPPGEIINEWEEKVIPNATHLGSPRYFGFVNGSGTNMSVFASALAASVNMNSGGWKAGPAATEIERRCIRWIAELIHYPPHCGGLFVGGGTIANYAALSAALRKKSNYNLSKEGLQSPNRNGRYLLYMSDHEGHISILKSADMMNLGRDAVRRVPSNADLTMNTAALRQMIQQDIEAGDIPFCVVAQVGSINVAIVDPLEEIASICKEFKLWFHADGACGAVGAMLPELGHLYKGLEEADSVTLDPHKWLYISYECGCLLVKDAEALRKTFSTSASYLQGTLPTDYKGLDYFDFGPQMSRGFNALKVWMTIKHYGREGYQTLLRQNILCAQHLFKLVCNDEDFISLHYPELFIYSFRYFPKQLRGQRDGLAADADIDQLNQKIADTIIASGFAFIMTSKVKGHVVLRLSICSHRTTLEDVEAVFHRLQQLGAKLVAEKNAASTRQ